MNLMGTLLSKWQQHHDYFYQGGIITDKKHWISWSRVSKHVTYYVQSSNKFLNIIGNKNTVSTQHFLIFGEKITIYNWFNSTFSVFLFLIRQTGHLA